MNALDIIKQLNAPQVSPDEHSRYNEYLSQLRIYQPVMDFTTWLDSPQRYLED